jgi:hypothetical protein
MNILSKTTQNILKIALVATLFMLSPFVTALAQVSTKVVVPAEYDSMYRYYALENKISRIDPDDEAENILANEAIGASQQGQDTDEKAQVANIIEKQDFYRGSILSSMSDIKNKAKLQSFIVGKSLGNLKFLLVQLKDEDSALERISKKTQQVYLQNQIADQVRASKQIEIEADNLILEQEGKFSLLGWFVGIL